MDIIKESVTEDDIKYAVEDINLFINDDANSVRELFYHDNIKLHTLFDNINVIVMNGKELPLILKTLCIQSVANTEVKNLKKLKNVKGIPKLFSYKVSMNFSYIIIEKSRGKELFSYINKLSLYELRGITKKILHILRDIHRKGIIHYDIKPENIMYDNKTGEVMIIDFGGGHTLLYQSPEHVKSLPVTEKSDVWSLGVSLYVIMNGRYLFDNKAEILHKKIIFPHEWSSDFTDFLSCLLERDPVNRSSVDELLLHEWLCDD